jgi:hypothetical protein
MREVQFLSHLKERGCRVALVVLREKELALPIEVAIEYAQLVAQQLLLKELLFQPERDTTPRAPYSRTA